MTWTVLSLVLFGAFLHASWNALVKSSHDKTLDTALIHILCSILAIPFVFYFGLPPLEVWPYVVGSLVVHIGYYFALSRAYHHGELSLTYPLMRGVAPMLVAMGSFTFLGESISLLAWVGVSAVCCGVLLLGVAAGLMKHHHAVFFALSNAVLIAIYTVIDAQGVRLSGNAAQYIAILFALDGWPFALIVLAKRKGKVWGYVRQRWPVATGGAVASMGSYSIALWAMTVAPVASVAALRETSVLFAAILGARLLNELWTVQRMIGILAIVAGVMALRMG
jgi:phosphonate utilization associated putative membrane protein